MKAILCGGRDHPRFTIVQVLWLDTLLQELPLTELIVGSLTGADGHGKLWADKRGVNCVTFWANWEKHGKGGGPRRNTRMLRYLLLACREAGEEPHVIAFDGGRGTADMCQRATNAEVPVLRWADQAAALATRQGVAG